MRENHEKLIVGEEDGGARIDVFLAGVMSDRFSRSQIKKWVEDGRIKVQGRHVSAHYRLKPNEEIDFVWEKKADPGAGAEDIPLEILFEDEDLIVVNKPAGMVVHPAAGNWEHTLVNALLFHTKDIQGGKDPVRPGIVHRLDKDTSGVMVVAKNDLAHRYLADQFRDHSIERMYCAVVSGVVQHDEGICEEPVGRAFLSRKKVMVRPSGGKDAVTLFKVRQRYWQATLLDIFPQTGRTHQIRVHLRHLGHPILGDPVYGIPSLWIQRQALHAKILGFRHPVTHEKLSFETEMPSDMRQLVVKLESQSG